MYPGTGVYGNTDVRKIYQGISSTGNTPLWIRYVVSDHRLRTDTGGIPQHGGPPDDQQHLVGGPTAVGIKPNLGGYGGGGFERGGGVHHLYSEYGCEIHCDTPKFVNIHRDRAEYGVMGIKTVVVTSRDKLHRGASGVSS